jgi:hypothetical protein
VIWPKKTLGHIKYRPRIDPTKVGQFKKIKILKILNNGICSIFPIDYLVFYVWDQKENQHLFSVQGFETETSNFALTGCQRVSKNQKNSAGSKKKYRLIPSTL